LYVLLAPKSSKEPQFNLCKTDKDGFVSPIEKDGQPSQKELKIQVEPCYLYLGLCPWWGENDNDSEIVQKAKKEYPEKEKEYPLELTPQKEKDLIFEVPEKSSFLPKGGELYDNLVLFMDMPNKDCQRVKDQVKRLQYNLGLLRYPIGDDALNPYIPTVKQEGKLDELTYNAVLAFQRHARQGTARKVEKGYGKMFKENSNFEVNPPPKTRKGKIAPEWYKDSWLFANLTWEDVEKGDKTEDNLGSDTEISKKYEGSENGVVDKATAECIQNWLKEEYRKPGHILVGVHDGLSDIKSGWGWYWLRDDSALRLFKWRKLAKEFGSTHGVGLTGTYRSITTDVKTAGPGAIRLSLHKTGLAVDLWTGKFTAQDKIYPVKFERETEKGNIYWRLYDETTLKQQEMKDKAKNLKLNLIVDPENEKLSVYRNYVTPWEYDPMDRKGGSPLATLSGDFVSLTELAKLAGYNRIGAHSKGWFLEESDLFLKTYKDFQKVVNNLDKCMGLSPDGPTMSVYIIPTSSDLIMTSVKELQPSLHEWHEKMGKWQPLPDVKVKVEGKKVGSKAREARENDISKALSTPNKPWTFIKEVALIDGNNNRIQQPQLGLQSIDLKEAEYIRPLIGTVEVKQADRIYFEVPGAPQHMEWWHFQLNEKLMKSPEEKKSWGTLLEEIGFTKEALIKIGYNEQDWTKEAG